MATRGRDLDHGIRITFLGGTNDGDGGASEVAIYTYESDKGEPFEWTLWDLLPSSTSSANESLPYISRIASDRCWAP